jgi:hypothetical protein
MLRATWLGALWQQALPRAALVARIARHGPGGLACVPFFSGRVGLAAVAALPCWRRRIALLPSYLCNVVPLAFERHGFAVHGYPVDDRFEPDNAWLAMRAGELKVDILLLAPLYGADGGLSWWLGPEGRATRRELGLTLVLDLCQDAGRLAGLPDPGPDCVVLTSFNDKAFPGAMGAALWTDLPVAIPSAPGLRAAALLNAWVLRRLFRPRRPQEGTGFEFSQASRFPYGFEPAGPTGLQLALGAIGLERLPRWQARRRAALARGDVRAQALPHAAAAPFVVAGPGDAGLHRAKRPYARADDASASLRPGLVVRHNKGFEDR